MADNLDAILKKTTPTPTPDAEDDEACGPCAAIAKNKWVTALTVQHPTKPWESFQYRGIATRSTFTPTRFEVRFVDEDDTYRVTVTGRNLGRVYNLVIQHRLEWVRPADRDFAGDGQPVITQITVEKVEAKQK